MSVSLAYVTVITLWSTTPLAIRWSLEGVDFSLAVLLRMGIGALVSLALLVAWRIRLPLHRRAREAYLAGGLGTFGAMTFTYWGARYIPSGLVSVIFGLTPLVTSLLAAVWLGERTLQPTRLVGLVLALGGLGLVFAGSLAIGGDHGMAGVAALLMAVLVYSISMVWVKRVGDDSPPLATTAGTLLVAMPLFALVWGLGARQAPTGLPGSAWGAIVYLGVAGSVLGFSLYYYVIKHMAAARVALITLITPVMALLLGHGLNGEPVEPRVWAGALLIGVGLLLNQWSTFRAAGPHRDGQALI